MNERSPFEARLERALRDFGDQAVMPFDADAVASQAIDAAPTTSAWPRRAAFVAAGIAAVMLVVVVGSQFIAGPLRIGGQREITADDLQVIVADDSNTPGTWVQTRDLPGNTNLNIPMRSGRPGPSAGFVDGRTTEMCGTDSSGEPLGCLQAWGALYETVDDAQAAYEFYLAEFAAPDGWDVPAGARTDVAGLGDEAVLYSDVLDPDGPQVNGIYLWRHGTLLMAAVGVAELDRDALRAIADAMEQRAD